MAQIVEHPLGVHLGQSHDAYIQDVGLGYSALKLLASNAIEWWDQSVYNPLRPPEKVNAGQYRGTALHVHFLDGLRVYNRTYGILPTKESHPDHLEGARELIAALVARKLPTTGLVEELENRLIASKAKPRAKLLRVARDRFNRSGRKHILRADDARIRILHRIATRSREAVNLPDGEHVTLKQAFHGALTEVSVYWIDENGVRQRARFDFMKPNFTGDLKAITEWKASDFKQSLLREAVIRGYVLQWVHYDEGRRQLRIACDEGRVFGGTPAQRKKLAYIAEADEWGWLWVFAKMEGAPQVRGIAPPRNAGQYAKAIEQREKALTNYLFYRELFGLESMWIDPLVVWQPEESDWPSWSVLPDA